MSDNKERVAFSRERVVCGKLCGLLISTEKGRRIPGGVVAGPLGGEQVFFSERVVLQCWQCKFLRFGKSG